MKPSPVFMNEDEISNKSLCVHQLDAEPLWNILFRPWSEPDTQAHTQHGSNVFLKTRVLTFFFFFFKIATKEMLVLS